MTRNAKGPAEAATSPDHGSNIHRKDIDMNASKPNTGAAPAPAPKPTPTDKQIIGAFCDLEHEICCLRSMINILGQLLDDNLVDMNTRVQSGQAFLNICLMDGTMNMLSFAWNDVIHRAARLERAFYAAVDGEHIQ